MDEARRTLRIERAPAAMSVHLLLPEQVSFSQSDKYQPEPEQSRWDNTWHLTASATQPSPATQFLAVLILHRVGKEEALPKVELVRGQSALGVKLTFNDGAEELIVFRADAQAKTEECGGLQSDARVFARRRDRSGQITRRLMVEGTTLKEKGKDVVIKR